MTPLCAGDQLDEYQLESLVASGGMASIFRARDTRNGRAAAIAEGICPARRCRQLQ